MKKIITIIILLSFAIATPAICDLQRITLKDTVTTICFSPNNGCTDAIINVLNAAKTEILVQAYSFTSAPIAAALVSAHKRGVKIVVILDKSQKTAKYTSATFLSNAGISTFIDSAHAIAHNKIIIVDQSTVITGSFNFTKAAEGRNAENLLIIPSQELANIYLINWKNHFNHSEKYVRENQ